MELDTELIDASLKEILWVEKYFKQVSHNIENNKPVIYIDFEDLYEFLKQDIYENLIDGIVINRLRFFVKDLFLTVRNKMDSRYSDFNLRHIFIRFKGVPPTKELRDINSDDYGRLHCINGVVIMATPPQSMIRVATVHCLECNNIFTVEQYGNKLSLGKCPCGNKRNLEIIPHRSEWTDYQEIIIQENPEIVEINVQPRTLRVQLIGRDLMDICRVGDTVNVTGYVVAKKTRRDQIFSYMFNGIYVDVKNTDLLEDDITEEDKDKILSYARRGDIEEVLKRSIFPSIYGNDYEKTALILSLIGGTEKKNQDINYRDSINTLLIGDPSCAKTAMMIATMNVAPRAIYTQAGGTSGVGLTAAAVQDESQWVLTAGAVVLANGGICIIDEIEKMSKEDQSKVLECMEKQTVTIHKASIHTTLTAKTTIIAAANPKYGVYDLKYTPAENIDLPAPLLSRFDLIFIMKDNPDEEHDRAIASTILRKYMEGEDEDILDSEFIRKYILVARNHQPKMTKEAGECLMNYYIDARRSAVDENQPIPISVRQYQGLIRLATAFAKMELAEEVTMRHAIKAIHIMEVMLERVGIDPTTGAKDINAIVGRPKSLQDKINLVLSKIPYDKNITREELASLVSGAGIDDEILKKILNTLVSDSNVVYQPTPYTYRRAS